MSAHGPALRTPPRPPSRVRRWWSLQVVRLALRREPWCRRTDRLEAVALLASVLLWLAALLVAGLAGSTVRATSSAEADRQAAERHEVVATVVTTPSLTTAVPSTASSTAAVTWTAPDGHDVRDTVPVPLATSRGSEITVWTTYDGRLTQPPLNSRQVEARADTTAVVVQLVATSAIWLALLGVRRSLDRRRYRDWESEWAVFDRDLRGEPPAT